MSGNKKLMLPALYQTNRQAQLLSQLNYKQSNLYIKATQGNLKMWPL